jgi:hypothetical protein
MSNDISRRTPGSAIAALCLLISGAGLLILLLLFEPFLRDRHVISLEFGGWLGMGLIALAAIFGATSRRSTLGKTVWHPGFHTCLGPVGVGCDTNRATNFREIRDQSLA